MPQRLTPLVNNYFYHVYNRGSEKRPIFTNTRDYKRSLLLIKYYNYIDHPIRFSKFLLLSKDQRKDIWNRLSKTKTYVSLYSYCLMPNHFHFLMKQNTDNGIMLFLRNFQNSYAKYFNIKYERQGPLFQNRFKVKKVDSEDQLLHLSRYIHLNPYSSAEVPSLEKLDKYLWSSFQEYTNISKYSLVDKSLIRNYFSNPQSYKEFVFNRANYQKTIESIKHLLNE